MTALLTIGALAVGLGAGLLIGWPIFAAGEASEVGSAKHDRDMVCEYIPDLADDADDDMNLREPPIWRLQSVSFLAVAAGLGDDPSLSGFEEAGQDLLLATSRLSPEDISAALDDLADLCG